jgi:quercetin dioxygenase-like cupin family protein
MKTAKPLPSPTTAYQAKFPVTLKAGEYDLQTLIMDFPRGGTIPNHTHGGFVLATVLNGEMTLKDKAGEKIIKAGESWTEKPDYVHSAVSTSPSKARIVVNMILPKGAEATTIVKP